MKILFALDDFPPAKYTSVSTLTLSLAKEFIKNGHEIFVITSVQDASAQAEEEYEGLKVFRIYSKYHERWRSYLSLYNPQVIFKFKKIIKKIKPDVVHFQHIHFYLSYYCLKIAKKYARAVFITAHDIMMVAYSKLMPKNEDCFYKLKITDQIKEAQKRYNPFRNIIIRHYLKYADKIFAISNAVKRVLEINGIKNIEIIYNGIDIHNWNVDSLKIEQFKNKYNLTNKKIVLFGGRLSMAKGGGVILEAMAMVIKNISNAILFVAGEKNTYSEEMEKLTKNLSINDNIKFTDKWLDRETMKCAFFSSDVCVTPSIYLDAFNLFNIEAGASKKPVVGTCFGGTPEIILDNQTGYIVNPNNIQLLSDKIIDLLKNPQKAKQFGEAGYERVKECFSSEEQAQKTLNYYKNFIQSND